MSHITSTQRYQIQTLLGKGGMAEVFLVADKKLHKSWAMKRIKKNSRSEILEAFYKEIRILSSIHHACIPSIIDQFGDDIYVYYIMDYFAGNDLLKQVKEKSYTFDDVLSCMLQICTIFIYLHSLEPKAIIYLDLKPENMIVDCSGTVHLVDFGTSQFLDELMYVSCATPRICC